MENNYIINFLKKNSFSLSRSLGGKNNIKTINMTDISDNQIALKLLKDSIKF